MAYTDKPHQKLDKDIEGRNELRDMDKCGIQDSFSRWKTSRYVDKYSSQL